MTRKLWQGIWINELRSPDGAMVTVADHGAHVLSWIPAGRTEAFFLSERSRYGGDSTIRGGVPIVFPQFAERGPGRKHGFVKACSWQPDFAGVEQEAAVARFVLTNDDVPHAGWEHAFRLVYEVRAQGQGLQMTLSVFNTADRAWEFSAALHTYLRVREIGDVALRGLQEVNYIDKVQNGVTARQQEDSLRMTGEIDRIYLSRPESLVMEDGARRVTVRQQGFSNVVVWNPGSHHVASRTDLGPEEYHSFLCVEAAAVVPPVTLPAGAMWQGAQTIEIGQ
jgi:glucose-6-phosphate 1-epimerase